MLNMRQKQALTRAIKKRYRSYVRRLFNNHLKTGRKKIRKPRVRIYDQPALTALKTIFT